MNSLKCWICGIESKCQSALMRHVWTHTGVRPHRCPHPRCKYASTFKANVRRHLMSKHASELNFKK